MAPAEAGGGMPALSLPPGLRVLEGDWLSANQILFTGFSSTALVDSGYATRAEATVARVCQALGGRPLDALYNTHLHSDHCGGNAALQRAWGCPIAVPIDTFEAARAWDAARLTFEATGQRCERFEPQAAIEPGQRLRLGDHDWIALPAPGHDPTALMLHQPEWRTLISADALWEHGLGVIFPELMGGSGFAEQRATLQRIARLDVAMVIPGHGRPFADVDAALGRAHARLDQWESDPVRHARYALKVLVKFVLLERGALAPEAQARLLGEASYLRQINERFFGLPPEALARQVAGELAAGGAARLEGGVLVDA